MGTTPPKLRLRRASRSLRMLCEHRQSTPATTPSLSLSSFLFPQGTNQPLAGAAGGPEERPASVGRVFGGQVDRTDLLALPDARHTRSAPSGWSTLWSQDSTGRVCCRCCSDAPQHRIRNIDIPGWRRTERCNQQTTDLLWQSNRHSQRRRSTPVPGTQGLPIKQTQHVYTTSSK